MERFSLQGIDLIIVIGYLMAIPAFGFYFRKFVKTGDKVVVKPNIGWDRSVEQGANTHPLVVKTLAEMVLEAGGDRAPALRPDREARRQARHPLPRGLKSEPRSRQPKAWRRRSGRSLRRYRANARTPARS